MIVEITESIEGKRTQRKQLFASGCQRATVDVLAERFRQRRDESWTPEHDDTHVGGEMADAAVCYAMGDTERRMMLEEGIQVQERIWPWDRSWWKPTTRRRDLVKAAALLIAEIERIDRAEERSKS